MSVAVPLTSVISKEDNLRDIEKQTSVMVAFSQVFQKLMSTMPNKTIQGTLHVSVIEEDELGDDTIAYIIRGTTDSGVRFGMKFMQGDTISVFLAYRLLTDSEAFIEQCSRSDESSHDFFVPIG